MSNAAGRQARLPPIKGEILAVMEVGESLTAAEISERLIANGMERWRAKNIGGYLKAMYNQKQMSRVGLSVYTYTLLWKE